MKFVAFALAIFIAGCASTSRQPIDLTAAEQIHAWQMKGRLAANINRDGGSATFIWHRQQDDHSIELYGPLGSGRVFLEQTNGKASLKDNQALFVGENLENVLFQRVGWIIPFDQMQQWVIGRPDLNAITSEEYETDQLVAFSQSGWHIRYDRFEQFGNIAIPAKLTITAKQSYLDELSELHGRDVDNVKVKLIIKEFTNG